MSGNRDPAPPWTFLALQAWARSDFPDNFGALSSHAALTFKEIHDNAEHLTPNYNPAKWPTGVIRTVLRVGSYEVSSEDSPIKMVYAFVYGEKHNQVGYVVEVNDHSYAKVLIESHLFYVDFDEPFSYLGNSGNSRGTAQNRLRALVCCYFVAAGVLSEVT